MRGTFEPDELGPNRELPRISPLCFDLGSDHQSRDREQQVGSFGADLATIYLQEALNSPVNRQVGSFGADLATIYLQEALNSPVNRKVGSFGADLVTTRPD